MILIFLNEDGVWQQVAGKTYLHLVDLYILKFRASTKPHVLSTVHMNSKLCMNIAS
jgi:hypothetical protein